MDELETATLLERAKPWPDAHQGIDPRDLDSQSYSTIRDGVCYILDHVPNDRHTPYRLYRGEGPNKTKMMLETDDAMEVAELFPMAAMHQLL